MTARLAALSCLMLASTLALAQASPGAHEPRAYVREAIPAAGIVGSGTLTWFGFQAYDATLFAAGGRFIDSQPFALELTYARDFKGVSIAERSVSEIRKLGLGSDTELAIWLDTLQKLFPDIRKGDRLTGVAMPNAPARFFHNGRLVGALTDERLARAFFAIWLDPRTSAPELRAKLLGQALAAR